MPTIRKPGAHESIQPKWRNRRTRKVRYAAEHRGAIVTGVNTTSEQVTSLEADIKNWKPAPDDRPRVVETDFRDSFASFDKVVSIGVLEHAGRDQLDAVIRAHAEFLKPGGLGVLHFIGHVGPRETEFFIRHYVFPGGWIPALSDVIQSMERWGLEVIDIENLRRHYALTLDEWLRRFDHAWPELQAQDRSRFDERFRRIWRTYLLACAEMFRSSKGQTHLYQITFSKGNLPSDATPGAHPGTYPMGRGFLYPSISTLRNSNARAHP